MSDRHELVRNAVAFLSDPQTQASPLAQRIQFLEAKGLSSAEIDDAFRQTTLANGQQRNYATPYPSGAYYAPHEPGWDWRDLFITAVISGTLVSGAVAAARKYLLPHLQPPTQTAYEADKGALTAQFDEAEKLLREIQTETAAVRAAVDAQASAVDAATKDVREAVQEMRDGEAKTRDEMREIRAEVDNVREMLPKMIEKNKESQNQSLAELQQELKSLKALLLSRGTPLPASPASPAPILAARPSIPAWQLAGIKPSTGSSVPSTPPLVAEPTSTLAPEATASVQAKGKTSIATKDPVEKGVTSDNDVASTSS
jgi:peroxin-14